MRSYYFIQFCFVIYLILTESILSLTPGKWKPLDAILLGNKKISPKKEIVKNNKNEEIYTANYIYDNTGKLIKETYKLPHNAPDGYTLFYYNTSDKVSKEELYNNSNELMEYKVYLYNEKDTLTKIDVYNDKKEKLIESEILVTKDDFIQKSKTHFLASKEYEVLSTQESEKNENTLIQKISDIQGKLFAEIEYTFDKNGLLIERKLTQGESKKLNKISYNDSKLITKYSFFESQNNEWVLIKTHELIY